MLAVALASFSILAGHDADDIPCLPASVCAFEGGLGGGGHVNAIFGVLGRCGGLAVSVSRFGPVSRFRLGNSRFPQIFQLLTSDGDRCAFPVVGRPPGRTRGNIQVSHKLRLPCPTPPITADLPYAPERQH
jgi:hypothetical protein